MALDWAAAGIRGLLIDLDGVVYTGRQAIPGSAWFLAEARQRETAFLLVTNNSTASPEEVAERLSGMGIEVRPDEILTTAQAAAGYVRAHTPRGSRSRVQLIGESGLRQAVLREGLEIVEDGQLDVDWVLAGLDRTFDYEKLTLATRSIRAGARFVATNADALLPIEGGEVLPGAGSIVAAIRAATAVEPIVVGKPEPGLFEDGLRRLGGLQPHQVVMIGDRLETDIAGGRRAGLHTILVLSGVARAQRAQRAERAQDVAGLPARERSEQSEQSAQPDAIAADLASVAALLGWR